MRIVRSKATRVSDTGKPQTSGHWLGRCKRRSGWGTGNAFWQLGKTMADLMGNHGYLIYGYNMFYNCS